jgi:hypothetical protein
MCLSVRKKKIEKIEGEKKRKHLLARLDVLQRAERHVKHLQGCSFS